MNHLQQQFDTQQVANEYQLVNGIAMHSENPDNFQIPPDVIKRHVKPNQFVELRIDSPRFYVHADGEAQITDRCTSGRHRNEKGIIDAS